MEGGRLLQILSLRRGANSKRGAYWKLGTNSSIYGISDHHLIHAIVNLKRKRQKPTLKTVNDYKKGDDLDALKEQTLLLLRGASATSLMI